MPIRLLILSLLVLCLAVSGCQQTQEPAVKVGVVDMNRLLRDSEPGKEASRFLEGMQKEIQQQAAEDKTPGNTEIMLVNASLLSVDTVGDEQIAQVYFNVLLREDPSQEAPIDVREIWHFVRPASGDGTWKLDGIQQVENV